MSEPIRNSEQLPIAWYYEDADSKSVSLYRDTLPDNAIPLYTHPPITQSLLAEPVAVRYEFDGHGYLYMDAGSGSDWASRVKDCEFLYTHPLTNAEPIAYCVNLDEDALIEASKILGLDSTDVNFLGIPLYTHPLRELSDVEYEKLMKQWDYWRKQISDGDTSSAPRDWFESTIDYLLKKASEK